MRADPYRTKSTKENIHKIYMDLVTKEDINIIKGKFFLPYIKYNSSEHIAIHKKIVIIDLDETLGSFSDLYLLWVGVLQIWPSFDKLSIILDMYPEFFRYGILTILEYIYQKKLQRVCSKLILYTNNQCSGEWVSLLCQYIESNVRRSYKKQIKLFDSIIGPYKIGNKIVEQKRTAHKKRMSDVYNYFPYETKAQFCFIDDVLFAEMKAKNVYYICPKPYVHSLTAHEMIKRITKAIWIPNEYKLLRTSSFWRSWFSINRHNMRKKRNDICNDLNISKKMLFHIKEFMDYRKIRTTNKTAKIRFNKRCKQTRKTTCVRSPSTLSTPLK